MMDENIRFETLTANNLPALADETIDGAAPGAFVPITKHRAAAMARNPFADPEDPAMVVAYQGNQVVGYFGIMPVMLAHEGQLSKVHWFSTWNVSPAVRGRGVGYRLMTEALKLGHDFMIVGSKPARKVSEKHGFHTMIPLQIAVLDFSTLWRFNPGTILLRLLRKLFYVVGRRELAIKKPVDALQAGFHRLIGGVVQRVFYRRLGAVISTGPPDLSMEMVDQVREERNTASIHQAHFYRGQKVINWMLKNPWVVHSGQSGSEHLGFYFSDARPEFESAAYEVFRDGIYQGYIVFQFSVPGAYRTLKVLDVDLPDESWVLPLAIRTGRQKRADRIEMNRRYAQILEDTFLGKIFLQQRQRHYQCYPKSPDSPLGRHWGQITPDYTDGDMAFT